MPFFFQTTMHCLHPCMLAGIHLPPHLCWHIAIFLGAQQDVFVSNKNNDPLVKEILPQSTSTGHPVYIFDHSVSCLQTRTVAHSKEIILPTGQAGRQSDNWRLQHTQKYSNTPMKAGKKTTTATTKYLIRNVCCM